MRSERPARRCEAATNEGRDESSRLHAPKKGRLRLECRRPGCLDATAQTFFMRKCRVETRTRHASSSGFCVACCPSELCAAVPAPAALHDETMSRERSKPT